MGDQGLDWSQSILSDPEHRYSHSIHTQRAKSTWRTSTIRMADEALECAICLEPVLTPQRLTCGHTFDAHCLVRILAKAAEDGATEAPCPVCRAAFSKRNADCGQLSQLCPQAASAMIAAREDYARAQARFARRQVAAALNPMGFGASDLRLLVLSCAAFVLAVFLAYRYGLASIESHLHHPTKRPLPAQCETFRPKMNRAEPGAKELDAVAQNFSILVGSMLGSWFGGWPGEQLGTTVAEWATRTVKKHERAPMGCTTVWLTQAKASLSSGRASHAIAHARAAIELADIYHAEGLMPPLVRNAARVVLASALERHHGRKTAESRAAMLAAAEGGESRTHGVSSTRGAVTRRAHLAERLCV